MAECYTPQEAERLELELDTQTLVDQARGELQAIRDQLEAELPASRALSLALTKLDEAGLWLGQAR